jgi:uncharacterized protein
MLPIHLLRFKATSKGKAITPLFCDMNELDVASRLIQEFEDAFNKKERKAMLLDRIQSLESLTGDYKLIRGLFALLERRCIFSPDLNINKSTKTQNTTQKSTANKGDDNDPNNMYAFHCDGINEDSATNNRRAFVHPIEIRRLLFQQSSKCGYALTDYERDEIISHVAEKTGASTNDVKNEMWSDLEENLLIKEFLKITSEELSGWYNLSLIQTLLFNCTKLDFTVFDGSDWKRVLRDVKKCGLMYNLQHSQIISYRDGTGEAHYEPEHPSRIKHSLMNKDAESGKLSADTREGWIDIVCSIDGPTSLFKLTDRYGTQIAKLVPSIISSEKWSIKAWIIKQNPPKGKKIYEFEISDQNSPSLLWDPYSTLNKNYGNQKGIDPSNYKRLSYDSTVEEAFASTFSQLLPEGWKMRREPNPLITQLGKALIADFVFEKYDKSIYLEIVGFWTKDYLRRKLQKMIDVIKPSTSTNNIDFFIAVNETAYASSSFDANERLAWKQIRSILTDERIIIYKNNQIPVSPLLRYLRMIDRTMLKKIAEDNYITLLDEIKDITSNDNNNGRNETIISISKLAHKHGIPIDGAAKIINRSIEEKESIIEHNYILVGTYLIPKSAATILEDMLVGVTKFTDACDIFGKNKIPESCYSEFIQKLGYDVVWKNMDLDSATIIKKN